MIVHYRVVPKTMYTAICNHCDRDILGTADQEYCAYTDADSVKEVIGDWDMGYTHCPWCKQPLTEEGVALAPEPATTAAPPDNEYAWDPTQGPNPWPGDFAK